jgi:MFS family permease
MVAEIAGLGSHGAIFGVVYFSFTSGGTLGGVLSGWIFDAAGSYQSAFLICIVLSSIAILLALLLKPITEKH